MKIPRVGQTIYISGGRGKYQIIKRRLNAGPNGRALYTLRSNSNEIVAYVLWSNQAKGVLGRSQSTAPNILIKLMDVPFHEKQVWTFSRRKAITHRKRELHRRALASKLAIGNLRDYMKSLEAMTEKERKLHESSVMDSCIRLQPESFEILSQGINKGISTCSMNILKERTKSELNTTYYLKEDYYGK